MIAVGHRTARRRPRDEHRARGPRQADPVAALHRIHAALAPWPYGISTLHCLTVSLAHGAAR